MVITELEKAWVRAATAKLIRQGKLKQQPCEVCGARETRWHHIDHTGPERIRWFCKRHKAEQSMSALQRSLLRHGLWAYYRTPSDIAGQSPDPGCFGLKTMMSDFSDRRERATRRAAADSRLCGSFAAGSWSAARVASGV